MALQREQVLQTAEKYVARGKIEPAIREYRKILAEHPDDINTLNRVGDLYARIHRNDEAINFFTQIADRYTEDGFFVKAIAIYKKIIKLDPTRLEIYEKLAELYHRQGLVNEARTQYQVLADYYQKHDDAASAIIIYQKMVELEPDNPTYHVKLADIYRQEKLVGQALGEYRTIAEVMLSHGRAQEAAQVYERALDVDSSDLEFIEDGLTHLRDAGHPEAAARFLVAARERNPKANVLVHLLRGGQPAPTPPPAPMPSPAPEPPPAPAPEPTPPPAPAAKAEPEWIVEEPEPLEQLFESVSLAAAELEVEAAEEEPAPVDTLARPAGSGPASEEIELDLDGAFDLDLPDDDDEPPTSLVKPPPDLASDTGRRPAWAQESSGSLAPPAPAEAFGPAGDALEVEDGLELQELEVELEIDGLDAGFAPEALAEQADSDGAAWIGEEPGAPTPANLLADSSAWIAEQDFAAARAPREPEPEPGETGIDADLLERTVSELKPAAGDRDEDLVTEAEVLAKYGLEDKALERLREALELNPNHLGACALGVRLLQGRGERREVVELASRMAVVASTLGDRRHWPAVRDELLELGYEIEGNRVAWPEIAAAEPAAPAEEARGERPPPPADEGAWLETPPWEMDPAWQPEAEASEPAAEEPGGAEVDLDFEMDLAPEPEPEIAAAPAPAPAPPPRSPAAAKARSSKESDELLRDILGMPPVKTPKSPRPAAPPPAQPPPLAPPPAPARPALFNPLEISELVESESEGWGSAPAPAAEPDLDDSSMSWLDDAGEGRSETAGRTEAFFEGDDFFDLGAEIEQELSKEDVFLNPEDFLMEPASEQSLEEIVEGFKKGVAEHLSPTDYDTHFNLGIAYREMGLLDEAIGEFQLASKSPGHLAQCSSMLGLSFLEKGLPELAVKWYRRGLEAPGLSEEEHCGFLYDLGSAYASMGDNETAYKTYVDLYGINSNYRDVVARLEELGR